jgi:hypothetical protein
MLDCQWALVEDKQHILNYEKVSCYSLRRFEMTASDSETQEKILAALKLINEKLECIIDVLTQLALHWNLRIKK